MLVVGACGSLAADGEWRRKTEKGMYVVGFIKHIPQLRGDVWNAFSLVIDHGGRAMFHKRKLTVPAGRVPDNRTLQEALRKLGEGWRKVEVKICYAKEFNHSRRSEVTVGGDVVLPRSLPTREAGTVRAGLDACGGSKSGASAGAVIFDVRGYEWWLDQSAFRESTASLRGGSTLVVIPPYPAENK